MRNGPFLAGYWKNLVWEVQGAKQPGSADGPATTCGPANAAVELAEKTPIKSAATAAARNKSRLRFIVFLPHASSLFRLCNDRNFSQPYRMGPLGGIPVQIPTQDR